MTAIFAIIPEVLPSAGAGDLVARFFASRSTIPSGAKLFANVPLTQTVSVLSTNMIGRSPGLVQGDLADLVGTRVTNASMFGASTLQVQPPAGTLRGTKVGNTSTIGAAPELVEAPADGFLRATKVTNTSTFGSNTLSEAESSTLDDSDDIIGGGAIAGTPL